MAVGAVQEIHTWQRVVALRGIAPGQIQRHADHASRLHGAVDVIGRSRDAEQPLIA